MAQYGISERALREHESAMGNRSGSAGGSLNQLPGTQLSHKLSQMTLNLIRKPYQLLWRLLMEFYSIVHLPIHLLLAPMPLLVKKPCKNWCQNAPEQTSSPLVPPERLPNAHPQQELSFHSQVLQAMHSNDQVLR